MLAANNIFESVFFGNYQINLNSNGVSSKFVSLFSFYGLFSKDNTSKY